MIQYVIPYNTDKNLGISYNESMENLKNEDDFCCFLDGDATFTTYFFGKQISDIVAKYPGVGCFTCYTNRIGCKWQILPDINNKSNDISYHRTIGQTQYDTHYDDCVDMTNAVPVMSGVLMLIRKKEWLDVGGFTTKGMLGIDGNYHRALINKSHKVYRMNGVYVYHWYRGNNPGNKKHLL